MRKKRRLIQRNKCLVWFLSIFVMVGMPLKFEKQVVGESMRSIPTMPNGHFFVLTVSQFFSSQSIVFDIVDGFKIKD